MVLLGCLWILPALHANSALQISGHLDQSAGDSPKLRFVLKNISSHVVNVSENYLPWGDGLSLDLYIIEQGKPPRVFKSIPFIGQVPATKIAINPNEQVTGLVDLRTRFPDLDQVLKQQVLIFWVWRGSRLARWEAVDVDDQIGGIESAMR